MITSSCQANVCVSCVVQYAGGRGSKATSSGRYIECSASILGTCMLQIHGSIQRLGWSVFLGSSFWQIEAMLSWQESLAFSLECVLVSVLQTTLSKGAPLHLPWKSWLELSCSTAWIIKHWSQGCEVCFIIPPTAAGRSSIWEGGRQQCKGEDRTEKEFAWSMDLCELLTSSK